jgi:DNA-binding NarL/FixJ family response regulator
MIRVFLADDHPIIREGLKRILSHTPDIVLAGETDNGLHVLKEAQQGGWDVLLLDLSLPGMSGLEVLNQLRHSHPRLRILVLSIHSERQYAVRVLRAGASGYLAKETAPETLLHAIRKVHHGGRYISEDLAEQLAFLLEGDLQKEPHEQLSDREFQIFLLIAQGKKASSIAQELHVSAKTIDTHRTRILQKLNITSNADMIHYAIKNSLIDI